MPDRSSAEILLEQIESADTEGWRSIEKFVSDRTPEDAYLDFVEKKDPMSAALLSDDKRNLSKAISGFAHSDGGLLVWGVSARRETNDPESPDIARELRPIQKLEAFYTNLNAEIKASTKPPVDGVRNLRLADPFKTNTGYIVTFVPVGLHPPYRAEICNNNFYKRSGSNFYQMEPYDLRDVILRGNYPKIELQFGWEQFLIHPGGAKHSYELKLKLINRGPTMVEKWKLLIECPPELVGRNVNEARTSTHGVFTGFFGPDGKQWERFDVRSSVIWNPGLNFSPIFPEDDLHLLGRDTQDHFYYTVFDNNRRELRWRFYGENAPAQKGVIEIGPGSFQKF